MIITGITLIVIIARPAFIYLEFFILTNHKDDSFEQIHLEKLKLFFF